MKKLGLFAALLTLCMLISFTCLPDAQAHPAPTYVFAIRADHTDLMQPERPYPCRNQHSCHNHNNHHHNQQNNGYDTTTTTNVSLPSGTQTSVARLPLPKGHYVVNAIIPIEFVATALPIEPPPTLTGQVSCSFSIENGLTDGLQPATAITSVATTVSATIYRTLPLTDSVTISLSRGTVILVCTFVATGDITATALAGTAITADQQHQLTFIPQ